MRPTTEKKFTVEILKGKDAAEAAFELLTNGTQLNNREREELESKLFNNLFLCFKYKLEHRGPGPWPECNRFLDRTNPDTLKLPKGLSKLESYLVWKELDRYYRLPNAQP